MFRRSAERRNESSLRSNLTEREALVQTSARTEVRLGLRRASRTRQLRPR